ncbi:hypothetical protein JHK86_029350 [Glycine max]|nr:hypothetical protein JHK86_029350 [Glycine max]
MRQGTYHIICSSFSVFIYSGYALSSVEGRVVMEFFDLSEASQAKMRQLKFNPRASFEGIGFGAE